MRIQDQDTNTVSSSGFLISFSQTASQFNLSSLCTDNSTPNLSYTTPQLWRQLKVIGNPSNGLSDIEHAKSNCQRLYDAEIQETQRGETIEEEKLKRLQIRKFFWVEKMQIQTERNPELMHLALKKRWIEIQRRQMVIILIVFIPPSIFQSSPNWKTRNRLSRIVQLSLPHEKNGNIYVGRDGEHITENVIDFGRKRGNRCLFRCIISAVLSYSFNFFSSFYN